MFDENYYLSLTQAAYAKELGGKKLTLVVRPTLSLVERIAEALKQAGIPEFNKGRVAKRIMDDLAKKKIGDLPAATTDRFKKVFASVNAIVAGWRKS